MAALLDLLKDKSTAGSGKTHPMRISSTREAAARALLLAGHKGEAALKDKGLAALREDFATRKPPSANTRLTQSAFWDRSPGRSRPT